GSAYHLQMARPINTRITWRLFAVPDEVVLNDDEPRSLPERDLRHGQQYRLPSGQHVAQVMGIPDDRILCNDAIGLHKSLPATLSHSTPLWYYILKEAELSGHANRLGPVGSRIVAEVLIGLMYADPESYLRQQPMWQPTAEMFGATTENGHIKFDLS